MMETMNAIKTGKLDMLNCAGLGNTGCTGGDICLLLDWLSLTNTPVGLEKQYPLKLADGTCKAVPKNATGVRVATYTCDELDPGGAGDSRTRHSGCERTHLAELPRGSGTVPLQIPEALATHGPVTVAVNALTWQNYLGGVVQYHC
ncbi:Cathepsin O2-like protease, partial [Operophtera brumata]